MNNYYRLGVLISTAVLFSALVACAPQQQVQPPSKDLERTCIQGVVFYRSPVDSSLVPFSNIKVAAWRLEPEQPLVETQADASGNYCIEVPLGDFKMELRVWGMVNLGKTSYTCSGAKKIIALGTIPKECGGNCIRLDMIADCGEFKPTRRYK